jgi:hypothetical protein
MANVLPNGDLPEVLARRLAGMRNTLITVTAGEPLSSAALR